MKHFTSLIILLIAIINGVCINASEKVMTFSGKFDTLTLSAGVDILYSPSLDKKEIQVKIIGPEELIENIKVVPSGAELVVKADNKDIPVILRNKDSKSAKIVVTGTLFTNFNTTSSGDIICNSDVKTDLIKLSCSSSGDIKFRNVTCTSAIIKTSSSGDIDIESLICTKTDIRTSSSGDIEIDYLQANEMKVNTSSSGDIEIENINGGNISASSSSSGDIKISGSVSKAILSASSSGDIDARRLKAANISVKKSSSGDIKVK
ncbi:MAG: DUF2807 domain-containing protein [Muribaculaceae bacterium]|nr:DUF2807 domain-containing protein [Muribaculaceae bacterium]